MTNQTKLLYTAMILAGGCLAHLASAQDTNAAQPDAAQPDAAQPDAARSEEAAVAEINGLVVDETITKVGRDFYEVFYSRWEPPPSEMSYTIFIKELPMPGRGSQVSVLMDDTQLFTQPVQPRYDVIESLAEYAVSLVSNYVTNYESMAQQLGNEDQRGSGIF